FHVLPGLCTSFILGWDIIDILDGSICRSSLTFSASHNSVNRSNNMFFPLPAPSNGLITIPFTSSKHLPICPIRPVLAVIPYDPTHRLNQLIRTNDDVFATNNA